MQLFIFFLLLNFYTLQEEAARSCSEIIGSSNQAIDNNTLNKNSNGFFSVIEWLVGNTINFYNVKFYDQETSDFHNGQELIVSTTKKRYNSVCEINRYGHVPLDKIVIGKCTCDGCKYSEASLAICRNKPLPGWATLTEVYYVSPEDFAASFSEVKLNEELGGVVSWKFVADDYNTDNNGLDFRLAMQTNKDKSGFFDKNTNITSDVPRHAVYINNWVNGDFTGWKALFKKASEAGVNYLLISFYTTDGAIETAESWEKLSGKEKTDLKAIFVGIRVLLVFGGENESLSSWSTNEETTNSTIETLVQFAKRNKFDGIEFNFNSSSNSDGKLYTCLFAYLSYKTRSLWDNAIISHGVSAQHFSPLVEDTSETNRDSVLDLFAEGKFKRCYQMFLNGNHRTIIPEPNPENYKRPATQEGVLPENYFTLVVNEITNTGSTSTSSTTSTSTDSSTTSTTTNPSTTSTTTDSSTTSTTTDSSTTSTTTNPSTTSTTTDSSTTSTTTDSSTTSTTTNPSTTSTTTDSTTTSTSTTTNPSTTSTTTDSSTTSTTMDSTTTSTTTDEQQTDNVCGCDR